MRIFGPGVSLGPEFAVVGATTLATSSTSDSVEAIFVAQEAVTITQLGAGIATRTGTPPTYQLSLQGVNAATGRADGSIKSSGNAKITFTPPADTTWNNTFQWFTLTSSYACSAGEALAWVLQYSSGTINASNRTTFRTRLSGYSSAFPYLYEVPGGVATVRGAYPVFGYRSSTTTYGCPVANVTGTSFSSNSTPDEQGIKFTLPGTASYSCIGARMWMALTAAGKTCNITLWDTNGTSSLASRTLDSDVIGALTAMAYEVFWAPVTLTGGNAYRISVIPQETTTAAFVQVLTCSSAQDQRCFAGSDAYLYTSRTDGGSWSDDSSLLAAVMPIYGESVTGGGSMVFVPVE